MQTLPALVVVSLLATVLSAQNDPPKPDPAEPAADAPAPKKDPLAKYHPQTGTVKVGDVAEVKLPEGWRWLDRADGVRFLVDRGNPRDPNVLGVAVPPDHRLAGTFTVYTYESEGHVDDTEAIDAAELLAAMQADVKEGNEQRKRMKLATVELLGWAEPPHVDKESHKLYWASRLKFEGQPIEALNYNVRVLGRTGHLVVNGVGAIQQLARVAEHNKTLLEVTEFVGGQRYSEFKPEYDKVAAYGIGALIAGKVALKVGLFAKLGLLLVKFLKPLLVGVAVIVGLIVKVITGRKKSDEEPAKA